MDNSGGAAHIAIVHVECLICAGNTRICALRVQKAMMPFVGKRWRQNNMRLVSAVYEMVRALQQHRARGSVGCLGPSRGGRELAGDYP